MDPVALQPSALDVARSCGYNLSHNVLALLSKEKFIRIEQVRKGGLPPLALPNCKIGDQIGLGQRGKPPFPTCSISVSICYLLVVVLSSLLKSIEHRRVILRRQIIQGI